MRENLTSVLLVYYLSAVGTLSFSMSKLCDRKNLLCTYLPEEVRLTHRLGLSYCVMRGIPVFGYLMVTKTAIEESFDQALFEK